MSAEKQGERVKMATSEESAVKGGSGVDGLLYILVSHLHEQVPVPSDGILRKCSWSLRLFWALPRHRNTRYLTILRFAPCNKTSSPQDDAASAKSRYEASPSEH